MASSYEILNPWLATLKLSLLRHQNFSGDGLPVIRLLAMTGAVVTWWLNSGG